MDKKLELKFQHISGSGTSALAISLFIILAPTILIVITRAKVDFITWLKVTIASTIAVSPLITWGILRELWYYNGKILLTETELIFIDLLKREIKINYSNIIKLRIYPSLFSYGPGHKPIWNCMLYYTQNSNLHMIKIPGLGLQEKEILELVEYIRNKSNLVKYSSKEGWLLIPWMYWKEYSRE